MDASNVTRTGQRHRWAVAGLFLMNGFLVGSWAPHIPEFVERLGISKVTLGLLILLFGVGAVVAMPWSGYLMSRHGSQKVLLGFAVVTAFGLLGVVLAPNVALAAVALFAFGGLIGGMDVAMNANAVVVERHMSRAIMSSSHAFWSLGGFFGGTLGGTAIQNFGYLTHALGVTLIALVVMALCFTSVIADQAPPRQEHHRASLPRSLTVYLVGLMALFSMIPEGAVLDWAALYLTQERGTDLETAGLAYGFFAGAMALMRFLGDGIRNRFGAVKTLRISVLIAAVGMLGAALAPSVPLTIVAFAICGIGIANVVPIIFSAGGNQPGMASTTGMSVVTTMGYSGILLAPSAIGFTAEHIGFTAVFIGLSALLVVVFLMGDMVHTADFDHGETDQ